MYRIPLSPSRELRVQRVTPPGCPTVLDLRLYREHPGDTEAQATAAGVRIPEHAVAALVAALQPVANDAQSERPAA